MPGNSQAEEAVPDPVSRLDNAGSLHQSVAYGVRPPKISILPGHEPDFSACTFWLDEEDHTLGNALRWIIMKDPDVEFCGYSAPHPSENKIHLRIQMYDSLSAVDCLRRALKNLRDLLTTIDTKYATSLTRDHYLKEDDVDVKATVNETLRQRGFGVVEDGAMDLS